VSTPSSELFTTDRPLVLVARNVSSRWLAIVVDTIIGLAMLPFNVSHLGTAAYGLWILTASITAHFSILNLGYAGALVKFVAQYRAHRSVQALNEIASTMFFVFSAAGLVAYAVAVAIAFNLDAVFRLTPEQAEVGRILLLVIGVHVAMNFPFSVYGGIVCGFQQNYGNGIIAIGSGVAVAAVNVAVLKAGYGLVPLVLATTVVRVFTYFVYRWNARRIYPALQLRWALFRRERLREVTGFSVYSLVIDWANKLNYQFDTIVIGAFLGPAPVAAWAVAERIIVGTQTLTNQVNGSLFPLIVDSDASKRHERLRQVLLQGTRLSLVMVLPIAVALIVLGERLILAWVGPQMTGSVPVLQILAIAVAVRVGNGTGNMLLKGAGRHRLLAWVNLAVGVFNVVLSVILARRLGLIGVAIGTLAALLLDASILYPAACRRVKVPLGVAFRRSILPAVWPALVLAAALTLTRDIFSGTLLGVLTHAALGGMSYLIIFFALAIGRDDRVAYIARAHELLRSHRPPRAKREGPTSSSSAAASSANAEL
jgi:O-antigen/teichoic acid export membrane protein